MKAFWIETCDTKHVWKRYFSLYDVCYTALLWCFRHVWRRARAITRFICWNLIRLKDQNGKCKLVECDNEESSTKRVQKHRAFKVKWNFRNKNRLFMLLKRFAKALDTSLSIMSPQIKVKVITQSCHNSLSPAPKSSLLESVRGHQIDC